MRGFQRMRPAGLTATFKASFGCSFRLFCNGIAEPSVVVNPKDKIVSGSLLKDSTVTNHLLKPRGPSYRYAPLSDNKLFLVEKHRLTLEERHFQVLFAIVPWFALLLMVAVPTFIVTRPTREDRESKTSQTVITFPFRIISFSELMDIVERQTPTIVFWYHPAIFASNVLLRMIEKLAKILNNDSRLSIVALDMSVGYIPEAVIAEKPMMLSPFLQLILPFALNGEPAMVDAQCPWSAVGILRFVQAMNIGVNFDEKTFTDAEMVDACTEEMRDNEFQINFVDEIC